MPSLVIATVAAAVACLQAITEALVGVVSIAVTDLADDAVARLILSEM